MHWLVVFLGLFMLFAIFRIPVAVSMSLATLITMAGAGVNFGIIGTSVFNSLNSFTFLAIPAFIIAGDIMVSQTLCSIGWTPWWAACGAPQELPPWFVPCCLAL
ncbi:hypothetical protein OCV64_01380 [Muriventricola aceti]|nr:TRAP transporter large permease subunit [Muriventricola aceti]MCU6701466.1 hypothetical protein [Muriventricola aceti]SCI61613.1 TRAP transporter%2C DctM subunit [uncultured Flavonifractor sp.]